MAAPKRDFKERERSPTNYSPTYNGKIIVHHPHSFIEYTCLPSFTIDFSDGSKSESYPDKHSMDNFSIEYTPRMQDLPNLLFLFSWVSHLPDFEGVKFQQWVFD